jgi:hypothetical protein
MSAICLSVSGLRAFGHRIGNLRGEQPDRAQRVVVARNHVIHFAGIAVGIDHRDHRNAQLARLAHRDLLFVRVDHEHRIRQAAQVLDARQVGLQVLALAFQLDTSFFGSSS